MLAYKVFGSGVNGLTTAAMCLDVASGLTATGTSNADAYRCTADKNAFSTVPANTGAILDSGAAPGDSQLIYNGGANPLLVYPTGGAAFNGQAVNTPMILPIRTSCRFEMLSPTLWTGVLSGSWAAG
jgi:hypothetical protein